jgi:lauroyl/myristoyl acyltransferase
MTGGAPGPSKVATRMLAMAALPSAGLCEVWNDANGTSFTVGGSPATVRPQSVAAPLAHHRYRRAGRLAKGWRTSPVKSSARRTSDLVSIADLASVVGLPVLAAAAWLTPARFWRACARTAGPWVARHLPTPLDVLTAHIHGLLGQRRLACAAAEIPPRLAENLVEAAMYMFATSRRGDWPRIDVSGQMHIGAALAGGRGAVLWNGYFAFDSLITKMALHRAGLAVSHLSHPGHSFSSSRIGMRVLNKAVRSLEDRYLGERVLLSLDNPVGAMRTLQERLRRNGMVSITARNAAQRPAEERFLDRTIELATSAPDLAHATGAVLLPVFTTRTGTDQFEMVIEDPIAIDGSEPRREASRQAVTA